MCQESLADIQQENALLKIRLSELVDESVMSDFLEKAELLHAELITNDESLKVLLDSANFLQNEISYNDNPNFLKAKLKGLAADVQRFQKRFENLEARFRKEFLLV